MLRRIQRTLQSSDPQRAAILSRLRAIYRSLPADGALVFFDVKPITVKAYGGRRFTAEKRPRLDRKQKTRGMMYLFLSYDLRSGKTLWAFLSKKNAASVALFMQKLRRHYGALRLWIALDQDRAHPCKCKATRRLMRQLSLYWISLPKGSPNDNPVETIFSGIQEAILDCSNDPDSKATQRRISRHLSSRNRRVNRFIGISYLGDSYKH